MEHKKNVDAVLSQLREEMEILADFEHMQDNLTQDRVTPRDQLVVVVVVVCVRARGSDVCTARRTPRNVANR